jgi:hypothetical protein
METLFEGVAPMSVVPVLAPPRTPRLKSLLRVESPRGKKEEASDRPLPHHGAKLLISLPVEQQLLELNPSGSKIMIGNSDIRPRRDAGEQSLVSPIPSESRCRNAAHPSQEASRGWSGM